MGIAGGILASAKHPFHKQAAACDYRIRGPQKVLVEGDFCYPRGFYSPYTCIIEVPHGLAASTA